MSPPRQVKFSFVLHVGGGISPSALSPLLWPNGHAVIYTIPCADPLPNPPPPPPPKKKKNNNKKNQKKPGSCMWIIMSPLAPSVALILSGYVLFSLQSTMQTLPGGGVQGIPRAQGTAGQAGMTGMSRPQQTYGQSPWPIR